MNTLIQSLQPLITQLLNNEYWLLGTILGAFFVLFLIALRAVKKTNLGNVTRTHHQQYTEILGLKAFVQQQTLPLSDDSQLALEDELISRDISPSIASRIAVNVRRNLANVQSKGKVANLIEAVTLELSHLLENSNEFKNNQCVSLQNEFDWITANNINVIMMCGVNGAGKTSTLAKFTHRLMQQNYSVMLVAGDTFRAGAIEQINAWADKLNVPLIKQAYGANPTAVIKDALQSAAAKKIDVLIVDTSGRQDNRKDLLDQLQRMQQSVLAITSNLRTYLVLDGTNGRNSLSQVEKYSAKLDISGLIVTKLDTVASGGGLLEAPKKNPINYLTYGEELTDIQLYSKDLLINFILGD